MKRLPPNALGLIAMLLLAARVRADVTDLADQPLFTTISVPGNLALTPSVEFPTAVSVANNGTTFATATTYLGNFDPAKCYTYVLGDSSTGGAYFTPAGLASATHACTAKWSGNFLNWAATQTIDTFRVVLTGGYRSIDTSSLTILEKAWGANLGSAPANYPDRNVAGAATINAVSATTTDFTSFQFRIFNGGNLMYFTGSTSNPDAAVSAATPPATPATSTSAIAYDGSVLGSAQVNTVYALNIRVKVCESAANLEGNCKQYGTNYKPEGLIQQYSDKIRFAIFGYLNDGSIKRDGGVLRAKMKFVGPTQPVPGAPAVTNPLAEWSATTGVFTFNPNPTDASDTGNGAVDSGVVNYLNKFGEASKIYKAYDPVSELYYSAVRYFKNQGNVPEYTNGVTPTFADGFPVITKWDDPIVYACQKNFILGIGDTNTHADANLPGNIPTSNNEPAKEAAVTADTTVDAKTATDKIGALEAASTDPYVSSAPWFPNTGSASPATYWCCNNNTFGMAGLAYDSHTKDIRPGDFKNADGTKLPSQIQTISTFWLDVLEGQIFRPYNQYWLAAKFGGFKVPIGYSTYGNTMALDNKTWYTTTDTINQSVYGPSYKFPRPDNYFTADNPAAMTAGLKTAFMTIAASISANSTTFNPPLPKLAATNNVVYPASYSSQNWSGDITAQPDSLDDLGNVTAGTAYWSAGVNLASQAAASNGVNGWDTGRIIATSTSAAAGKGVPFRTASLSSSEKAALTPLLGTQQNLLDYTRGDTTNDGTFFRNRVVPASGSTAARTYILGDIVDGKVLPISAPSAGYSDSSNPGYSAFRSAHASRPTVVYAAANDGMLHAFNGAVTGSPQGNEMFAYIPSFAISGPSGTPLVDGLASRSNIAFIHHFLVDATPVVNDVDFKSAGTATAATASTADWHSVLIGGLGKGGKGFYALDMTAPESITSEATLATKVLWEFTDSKMGYSFGPPIIAKTKKYGWVAILTSGYNNSDGKGYLFIVNAATGALLETVKTSAGSASNPSGLAFASAYAVDYSSDVIDSVYAGDLLGNVWRFDLTGTSGSYPDALQFATLSAGGTAQPVTSAPLIEYDPKTLNRYVLIGTGKLLGTTDSANSKVQSFYAINDGTRSAFGTSGTYPITRAALQDDSSSTLTGLTVGTGYYIDLPVSSSGIASRVIGDPVTADRGRVAFAATQPNGDPCNPNGTSLGYSINFGSGKSVLYQNNKLVPTIYIPGVVTELTFVNVGGKLRLEAGNDQGAVVNLPLDPTANLGLQRLNWREIPLVN